MPTSKKHAPQLILICDSREQLPWTFCGEGVSTERRALPAGDYSIAGHETEIAIERKSLDDLTSTLIRDRDRFGRELDKLAKYRLARIVVEGSIEDIAEHHYKSFAHPNSILGSCWAIEEKYGVPIIWAGNREYAQKYAQGLLARYWTQRNKDADVENWPSC